MKRVALILMLAVSVLVPQARAQVTEMDIARKQLELGVFMLKEGVKKSVNVSLSPYSIHSALMLLRLGARGEIARRLDQKLLPTPFSPEVQRAYAYLNSQVAVSDDVVTSRLANSVWLQTGYEFQQSYLTDTTRIFASEPRHVNFSAPEAARASINEWVSSNTNSLIPSLLPAGSVTELTTCILVNALYFKSAWLKYFEKNATKEEEFWIGAGNSPKVSMMHKTDSMDYFENDRWQGVRLPYQRMDFMFVVLVPKQRRSATEVAKELSTDLLTKAVEGDEFTEVRLFLPRFKVRFSTDLLSELSKYGLQQFQIDDYSGISARGVGSVGQVIHEAVIAVDEGGTEAAAATAVTMTRGAFKPHPPQPKEVKVDRPFAFALMHRSSKAPLFLGVVGDPR